VTGFTRSLAEVFGIVGALSVAGKWVRTVSGSGCLPGTPVRTRSALSMPKRRPMDFLDNLGAQYSAF